MTFLRPPCKSLITSNVIIKRLVLLRATLSKFKRKNYILYLIESFVKNSKKCDIFYVSMDCKFVDVKVALCTIFIAKVGL